MKKIKMFQISTLLIITSLLASCSTQKSIVVLAPTPFDGLIGHWEGPLGGGTFIEKWEKIASDYLQGEGFWIRGGDTILVENISIRKLGEHWAYIAIINNSAPTLFTATKVENNNWVFRNPEHDYPQEVGYELKSQDELQAWTDGKVKGKARKDEYFLKRMAPKK
ncbi:MAG: hypothetical protein KTR30_29945 [Saprospiraceae bacterium]|nr:hypothetical protein [Saprospiraceae bacterium]